MSYLAEAHFEWHAVNGAYAVCPLDCGAGEAAMLAAEAEAEAAADWAALSDDERAELTAEAEAQAAARAAAEAARDPWDAAPF